MTAQIVGLSGGKDSTALALRLKEVEPGDYEYLITPTGDELPEMLAHWQRLETLLGKPLTRVTGKADLRGLIKEFGALPNWRQRWCTRMLKIEPCIAWMRAHAGATLHVGLRADEEERKGLFSEGIITRFPLREWGWGVAQVKGYLAERGVTIPTRTDCARCYGQRIDEWWNLWKQHPDIYADAESEEALTGHTFRSPGRDTWPAALADLRAAFEAGRTPRRVIRQLSMLIEDDSPKACRVCSL